MDLNDITRPRAILSQGFRKTPETVADPMVNLEDLRFQRIGQDRRIDLLELLIRPRCRIGQGPDLEGTGGDGGGALTGKPLEGVQFTQPLLLAGDLGQRSQHPLPCDGIPHRAQQKRSGQLVLHKIILRTTLDGLEPDRFFIDPCEDHDRRMFTRGPEPFQREHAGTVGQRQVEQHHIDAHLTDLPLRFLQCSCHDELDVVGSRQQSLNEEDIIFVVFDQKAILLPAHVREVETFVVRHVRTLYQAVLVSAVRNYRRAAVVAAVFLALSLSLSLRLGTEFLPKLEEGNMWIRAVMPPTITLEAGMETVAKIRTVISSYPPVKTVFSEQGRGEEGTDPDGSFLAEFFVPLKPADTWPPGLTKERMVKQLSERLNREFVGVDFNFSQYIQDNIEEAVSGVKGENSIKIFGKDLVELERLSKSVKTELAEVHGVADPASFNLLGQPNLVVRIDRAKAARYGFSVADINSVVQAAIGGQEVSKVYEGEMIFALTVRLAPEFRTDVEAIRTIPVALPNSDPKTPTAYIRLGDLGEVKLVSGASYIYRENSQRFIPLKYSVRDRDLGSTVTEAQDRIGKKVPLPQGYSLEWSGEYGALVDAKKRLALIVPLSLLLILMLLYSLFNSIRDSLLALSGIPFAVAGGILGLYIGGLNFSVSAAVGFISLFGVSAMDGILLMSYIRRDIDEGMGTEDAIIRAAETRMRQILMTGLSACIGLVPAAISTGIGSQVQQPLACVIVGGMLLSPICSLLVIPVLARLWMPTIKKTGIAREAEAG